MIRNYIQAVSEKLIQEKNFLLVDKEFKDNKIIFVRNGGQVFSLIELYDLDSYTEEDIQKEIVLGINNLHRIVESPTDYKIFKVFISQKGISDALKEKIKWSHVHDGYHRKYIKPIHVELDTQTITCCYDRAFPDYGLIEVLYDNLEPDKWLEGNRDNLLQLDLKKQEDYKVTLLTHRPITVRTVIALNITIYLLAMVRTSLGNIKYIDFMRLMGIKDNLLIREGEYFRLVAPIFLHGGLMHLMTNCYSLSIIGPVCEKLYGNLKFIGIDMLSGIGGFIFSFALSESLSLGASGAVFGVMGALLYFGIRKPILFRNLFGTSFLAVIAMNVGLGFVLPNIDSWGHVGGLIGGFLAAGMFRYSEEDKWYVRIVCLVLFLALYGGLFYMGMR